MTKNNPIPFDLNLLLSLRSKLEAQTSAEVRFDAATRAIYASEASNYRQLPIGIVIPRSIADIEATVRLCREAGIPILPRGAGTSMCGQAVNAAVVIDASKYLHAIHEINPEKRLARVEPGVICDQLKGEAAKVGLTFGPDPATHSRCTLGGMIGNNSCGAHSVMAGKTVENVERLEVLTYDGERFWVGPTDEAAYQEHIEAGGRRAEIVRALKDLVDRNEEQIRQGFPKLKRRVSGYNLDQLLPENGFNIARALVGVEGTCVTVLQAETILVKNPTHRVLVVLGYEEIYYAADSVPQLLPLSPIAMEGLDDGIIDGLKVRGMKLADIAELPAGNAWLMIEFGALSTEEATAFAQKAVDIAPDLPGRPSVRLVTDSGLMNRIWTIRETGASATSLGLDPNEPDPVVGWEDAAVEPEHLGKYLREFKSLVSSYGYKTNLYGHFGDGCIHSRITFDLKSRDGVDNWRAFLDEAAHLVVRYGGSLSGEHGDGQAKGEYLRIMYSDEIMNAFADFKSIWDPLNKMNPGKLIHAMPVDANLRLGPDYQRREIPSQFTYDARLGDKGLARETERCIGMGKCRSLDGGTMCPSFRATREEKYSTRGRARLFFELLKGEVIEDAWQNEEVKDSLDLCLSCKGCKTDCPTNVNIARYKTEFLSRYYSEKRRPVMDAMIGRIGEWLPHATKLSPVLNYAMGNPLVRTAGAYFGLARQAKFPKIASKSFRSTATAKRILQNEGIRAGNDVLLWVDSFNNGFTPNVLEAGVTVLEALGFTVKLMKRHVCCGRPYYDVGMIDEAKSNLEQILTQLEPVLEDGLPVIVLEPSCLSVFRDEMPGLFPNDKRAKQLEKSIMTLSEFIKSRALELPSINEDVRIHGHCHQKSCGGMGGEQGVLEKLGGKGQVIAAGCCGVAGAYAYHSKTAPIAKIIGENEFKPHIDKIPQEAAVVADGFSCRGQIRNVSGREAMHLAEYLAKILG
ncbi:FAD-binding and (Fe-S)-binding domain-containing protein [Pseudomonas kermanshahensis]|uniref:FAD-binding and (Fe-S)-binding domain-containing protein n=1 Tax=Pseudomonas kermanshahensis TaxID=2745482 RepID=UPI0023DC2C71|nr:FAD-binding and (Fe-S)-binding domain-containing protein [Pseudomonas kermanshahensis]WEL58253.1 FAD-binding and (Fe-S)-binding domain-containing protein [Pseudomonas kermanshahensis]